ncbi:MAG: glycosyltransferase family 4 protein [Thermodesulfobacteriota bacterium]
MSKYLTAHIAYTFIEDDFRVLRYVQSLAGWGHRVHIFCLSRPGRPARKFTEEISVFHLQNRKVNETDRLSYLLKILSFFVRSMLSVSYRCLREPYRLVHVHNVPDFLVFAAWFAKLRGAKIILDIHDILPELYASKFGCKKNSFVLKVLIWLEKLSCRFADHVIVANDIWKDKLISRSVSPARCTSILNYPETAIFKPLMPDEKPKDGKFILLYPGTLNRHQGLDVAVEAMNLLKHRIPEAELHIYGEGTALPSLKEIVSKLGLNGRVIFKDPLPIDEIAKVIAQAHVGVIPKRAEGFGDEAFSTKSMEFMACGVPVVMSRTRIDSIYFTENEVWFFPSGDAKALAEIIWHIYSHPEEAKSKASAALALVARENWENRQSLYLDIVNSLISRGSKIQRN